MEAATSHTEDATVLTEVDTAHVVLAASRMAPVTIHKEAVTAHTEDVAIHIEDATACVAPVHHVSRL